MNEYTRELEEMAFTVREMEVLLFCFHEEINEKHTELSSEVKETSTIKSGDVHFSQEFKAILNKPVLCEKVSPPF